MANANIKHGEIIDYAMPMMQIEQLMRRIHDHCLNKKYEEASDLCPHIIAEARMLSAALALMSTEQQ